MLVDIVKKIADAAQQRGPASAVRPERIARKELPIPLQAVALTDRMAPLHGVPAQPPNYLRRDDHFEALRQAVLSTTHQATGITGVIPAVEIARIGLHGMGGIGKTVLAIDLVHDEEIQRAFPDGIFWLTIGQSPEPLQLQSELVRFIGGEPRTISTVHDGRDQLRQLFKGKACLLVLDDLWRVQDAEPFDVLGPRSRLLTTTRDADLLIALGARQLPLDVLSEDLSLELLASWSGQSCQALPPAARQVAQSCGYLPLALALAGAHIQGGGRWEDVRAALEHGRLEFLDHPYGSVFKSLRMSTDALPTTHYARYFDLAVFPEDVKVPVEAIGTLWRHTGRLEEFETRDLLHSFERKSLLTLSDDGERVSFHDLQHDFLRLNVGSLTNAQDALIKAYRSRCADGWASGPNDGYFFPFLPRHLAAAGQCDELEALLADYAWMEAKLKATDIQSVISDYNLVANEPDLNLLQRALRLSIPALSRDPKHLPSQLIGRLRPSDSLRIAKLLQQANAEPVEAWLCPETSSLEPPGAVLRMMSEHKGPIRSLSITADEKLVISASEDKTVKVWDLETNRVSSFEMHRQVVRTVAIASNARRIISGSSDRTLVVWDLSDGSKDSYMRLPGHDGRVLAVAITPDGKRAASASTDRTLRSWDLERCELQDQWETFHNDITSVAVTIIGDDCWSITGFDDATLRYWHAEKNRRRAHGYPLSTEDWVVEVAITPDARHAVACFSDRTIRLYDLTIPREVQCWKGHARPATAISISADGRRVVSGSPDDTIRIWDRGKDTCSWLQPAKSIRSVTITDDGHRAISGHYDGIIKIWNLDSVSKLTATNTHHKRINAFAVTTDKRFAISASDDAILNVWDLLQFRKHCTLEGHKDCVRSVAIMSDDKRAISAAEDGTLRVWDINNGNELSSFTCDPSVPREQCKCFLVTLTQQDRFAVYAMYDWSIVVYDMKRRKLVRKLIDRSGGPISAFYITPNGRWLVSGHWHSRCVLWDLSTGSRVSNDVKDAGRVEAISITADGTRIVAGFEGGLYVWDVANGNGFRECIPRHQNVRTLLLKSNGTIAVSSSDESTLRIWDLDTGSSRRFPQEHSERVTSLAIDGDWHFLVSGSEDKSVVVWDMQKEAKVASFVSDDAIRRVAVASKNVFMAGGIGGAVHILRLKTRAGETQVPARQQYASPMSRSQSTYNLKM